MLHDVRSVSKSVVGLLYGIALAGGKVPPEAKLYEHFPEYPDLAAQPGRDRLTIHHALSMTLGLEWDELTLSYDDPRNSDMLMEAAPDRVRFVLERPIVSEPGVKWTYCGGATALLGRLIAKGTGETHQWYMGDFPAGTSPQPYHWRGGVGWGGQYLLVFPKLDLVVAMNCGSYHKPLTEQSTIARTVVAEVVLPGFEQSQWPADVRSASKLEHALDSVQ